MPYGSVRLVPGVDVERTPTLNEAGVSSCQLIRYRDSLIQKYGGWQLLFSAVEGLPRELHAWQDLNDVDHLGIGTTTQLGVLTSGSYANITPQILISDFAPNFSTIMNSPTVTIVDSNIANISIYDSVLFNTPISVGGIILSGLYPITLIVGSDSYQITASMAATSTVNNGGAVPAFTTVTDSNSVEVLFAANGQSVGDTVIFPIATTGNGVTIEGAYSITSIFDADNFFIAASTAATGSSSFPMNGGSAELVYYIAIGPLPAGTGFGLGTFGGGGFGYGSAVPQQTGEEITATDWTSDNWGEIFLACPSGGGVYQYNPTSGFFTGQLVATAPVFNGGLFVSTSEQILVCWGSTVPEGIGIEQDPLQVAWSTIGDYTTFTPLATNSAGTFRIPTGSMIRGGLSAPQQNLIWTDLDCWAMNFIGGTLVFGFNKIGAGAGMISSHAAMQLRGNVYWMGNSNFFAFTGSGVAVLPCPVWDFVFQNINTAFQSNVRAMPNTSFNEVGWLFPSNASVSGECDCYVKLNITEPNAPWDFGPSNALQRSAWADQSVLGNPIGASSSGILYTHETTPNAAGVPLVSSFTTGYFYISEGQEFCFVDQIIPDFIWGTFGGAQTATINLTFNVVNSPGDTPSVFGPYEVTQSTPFISVRFRGRQMSITASSSDLNSFWRLGKIRYRYAPSGRNGGF